MDSTLMPRSLPEVLRALEEAQVLRAKVRKSKPGLYAAAARAEGEDASLSAQIAELEQEARESAQKALGPPGVAPQRP